ncbi:MAG: hypothetical protein JW820_05885 [Spirochaetales bacterium]|nr:hypothetical protein [Spirochaetales bacterium]
MVAQERYEEAEEALRRLEEAEREREARLRAPEARLRDPEARARASFLRGRIAAGRGDTAGAAFHLKAALDGGPPEELLFELHAALGDLRYQAGDSEGAFGSYLRALQRVPPGNTPGDLLWLRLAEIAFYRYQDRELARYYLLQAPGLPGAPAPSERTRRLLRRVSWRELSPEALGVGDGNISALAAEGDDLWIGTWNGGVLRYSLSSGRSVVFREGRASLTPNTVRAIEITDTRVWVGTYQGLFVYSKPTSTWSEVAEFGGVSPKRAEAIEAAGGDLYVGTLGDGLWRLRAGRWSRIGRGVLPGDFVNALSYADSRVLIGTLNLGIVVLDPSTESMWSFDQVNPNLQARNVVLLLPVGTRELWIGTYGQGLYRWDRVENRLSHFDKAGGALGDDWVLCGAATPSGLYFGSFGAGASRHREGRWEQLGLREGLTGLDVSAVAYVPPYVVFGTLGSGVALFDESLALAGFPVIE